MKSEEGASSFICHDQGAVNSLHSITLYRFGKGKPYTRISMHS